MLSSDALLALLKEPAEHNSYSSNMGNSMDGLDHSSNHYNSTDLTDFMTLSLYTVMEASYHPGGGHQHSIRLDLAAAVVVVEVKDTKKLHLLLSRVWKVWIMCPPPKKLVDTVAGDYVGAGPYVLVPAVSSTRHQVPYTPVPLALYNRTVGP